MDEIARELRRIANYLLSEARAANPRCDALEIELSRYARPILTTILHAAEKHAHPVLRGVRKFASAFHIAPDNDAQCLFLWQHVAIDLVRQHWPAAPSGLGGFAGNAVVRVEDPTPAKHRKRHDAIMVQLGPMCDRHNELIQAIRRTDDMRAKSKLTHEKNRNFAKLKPLDEEARKVEPRPLVVVREYETMSPEERAAGRCRQMKDWAQCCEWLADVVIPNATSTTSSSPRTTRAAAARRVSELRAVHTDWKDIAAILNIEFPRPAKPWKIPAARGLIRPRAKRT